MKPRSRRAFIQESLALAATAAVLRPGSGLLGQTASSVSGSHPIRLGGPSFAKTEDPEALALAHRKLGYSAAYCPNVALNDTAKISALRDAFAKHDVVIAEVGRWCNLLDPDPEKRRKNLQTVTDGLALAEAVGARCCVDIAGSFNETSWFGPHPDNLSPKHFDASVENARKIIDAVKPKRARFCLRDDGLGLSGQPGQLSQAGQGGGSAGLWRPPRHLQPHQLAREVLSQHRPAQRVLRQARAAGS